MNISEAGKVCQHLMEIGLVPMLVGATGIGKTTLVKNIGARTGRKVIILTLSQMEPGDLLGLPMKDEKKTVFAKPDWFPEDDKAIIFLDELNRAHASIRAAIMQLLLDKKIHTHELPKGVWMIAAMNPDTEDYAVNPVIDKAEIARFVWLNISNSPESWYEYAIQSGAEDIDLCLTIRDIVMENPSIVAGNEPAQLPEIVPTYRSFDMFRKVVATLPQELDYLLPEVAAGILGKLGPVLVRTYRERLQNEMRYKDLLEGNVEKVKASSSQARIRALDGLVSYLITRYNPQTKKLNVSAKELENAVLCLEHYRKEELAPIFRTTKKEAQDVFNAWKQASEHCRKFLMQFVLDALKNASSIEQIQG